MFKFKVGDRIRVRGYMDHNHLIKTGVTGTVASAGFWPKIELDSGETTTIPEYNLELVSFDPMDMSASARIPQQDQITQAFQQKKAA